MTKEVSYFSGADADIARGHVSIRADMAEKLGHKALAEAHNFHITFALRVEVRAAFCATHHQAGQRILKNLFESEEFDNANINARMETEAALIGPQSTVKLSAKAAVYL
ncbi:hypothetical protein ES703_114925 [subsurface metagenome]